MSLPVGPADLDGEGSVALDPLASDALEGSALRWPASAGTDDNVGVHARAGRAWSSVEVASFTTASDWAGCRC